MKLNFFFLAQKLLFLKSTTSPSPLTVPQSPPPCRSRVWGSSSTPHSLTNLTSITSVCLLLPSQHKSPLPSLPQKSLHKSQWSRTQLFISTLPVLPTHLLTVILFTVVPLQWPWVYRKAFLNKICYHYHKNILW